jgi:hypothetical protein
VNLPRTVTATVSPKPDRDEVSLGARGQSRRILLCALQDKPAFAQLVQRLGARVVPCVDGQIYCLPTSATDGFLAAVGRLVEDYLPELAD